METELRAILVRISADFARLTGRKETGIWASAVGDARFLDRVGAGQTFTLRTFDRAVQWFSDHWPAEAPWPADIARPEPRAASEAEFADGGEQK